MRKSAALLLVLALVGCSGDDAKSNPSTTVAPVDKSTTTEFVAPSSTAALVASSSATTIAPDDNPGTESIGVTEKITIVITDPED